MKKKILSPVVCLMASIIWGGGFYAQEVASRNSDKLDALFFAGIRFGIGALVLVPIFLIFEKNKTLDKNERNAKTKNTILYGFITGLILSCATIFQQYGIQLTGESGEAGFITGLYIILVPIISFVFLKRKISPTIIIAIAFTVAGLYFLTLKGNSFEINKGEVLVFISSVMFAVHIIVIDLFISKVNVIRYSCVQFSVVSVISLILGLIFGHITWDGVVACTLPIIYCGVLSTGIAYTCQMLGQKITQPTVAAILFSTEGLFSVVIECIMEKRFPPLAMVIGCLLMLCGIILSQIKLPVHKHGKISHNVATDSLNNNEPE